MQTHGPLGVVAIVTLLFFFMVVRPLVGIVLQAATPPEPLALPLGPVIGVLETRARPMASSASRPGLTERLRAMVISLRA